MMKSIGRVMTYLGKGIYRSVDKFGNCIELSHNDFKAIYYIKDEYMYN